MYFGKVRAAGSTIRGFQGAAGGVIRWIRLVNDTAVAVDQLGMRQGAVAVYLDAWHRDLPVPAPSADAYTYIRLPFRRGSYAAEGIPGLPV